MLVLVLEGDNTTITAGNDSFDELVSHGASRCFKGVAKSFAVREYLEPLRAGGEFRHGRILKIGDWRDDPRWRDDPS